MIFIGQRKIGIEIQITEANANILKHSVDNEKDRLDLCFTFECIS